MDPITRACGSRGARWYCVLAKPRQAAIARDELQAQGFRAFLPLVAVERRHARQTRVAPVPMFGRYLFTRLDLAEPGWRRAWNTRGVVRLLGPPEQPTPVPDGLVEALELEGHAKPITRDMAPALLAAGAEVRLVTGPMTDARGLCIWDDGQRVAVLLDLLGRRVKATVPREQVAAA